jgi:hypothetical protein
MSDRLAELRRQRALVLEHVAWLDREIAAATPLSPIADRSIPPLVASPQPTPAVAEPGALPVAAAPVGPEADAILDDYRVPETSLKSDVRKGCLLYFVGAFLLVGLGVVALYFLFQARR